MTSADLSEADTLSTNILKVLRPSVAHKMTEMDPKVLAAINARDRLFTILARRHADLIKAGTWIFGRDVNEHVPPLGARIRSANAPAKGTAAPPANASSTSATQANAPAAASTAPSTEGKPQQLV